MVDRDFSDFSNMLDSVCSLLSRGAYVPSPNNTALFFRALARHDIATVRRGFDGHVSDAQRGRFVPTPADILAQIEGAAANDGRPGAEEAWATALKGADEDVSLVWTDETARAWGIALPVFHGGDEVGARMAFKEAYARLVTEARAAGRPVNWNASLGTDAGGRDAALQEAQSAGLLGHDDVLRIAGPAGSFAAQKVSKVPEAIREQLARVKAALLAPREPAYVTPEGGPRQEPMMIITFTPPPEDTLPPGMRGGQS